MNAVGKLDAADIKIGEIRSSDAVRVPAAAQKACPSCRVIRDPEVDHRPAMLEIGSYDHALRSYDEELHVVGYTCRCCGHRWWEPK